MLEGNQWKFLARLSFPLSTKARLGRLRFVRDPFAFGRVRCLLELSLQVRPLGISLPREESTPQRRHTGRSHSIFRTRGGKKTNGQTEPPLWADRLLPPSTSATSVVSPFAYPSAAIGRDQRGPEQHFCLRVWGLWTGTCSCPGLGEGTASGLITLLTSHNLVIPWRTMSGPRGGASPAARRRWEDPVRRCYASGGAVTRSHRCNLLCHRGEDTHRMSSGGSGLVDCGTMSSHEGGLGVGLGLVGSGMGVGEGGCLVWLGFEGDRREGEERGE